MQLDAPGDAGTEGGGRKRSRAGAFKPKSTLNAKPRRPPAAQAQSGGPEDTLTQFLTRGRAQAEAQCATLPRVQDEIACVRRQLAVLPPNERAVTRARLDTRLARLLTRARYLSSNGPMKDFARAVRPYVLQHAVAVEGRAVLARDAAERARRRSNAPTWGGAGEPVSVPPLGQSAPAPVAAVGKTVTEFTGDRHSGRPGAVVSLHVPDAALAGGSAGGDHHSHRGGPTGAAASRHHGTGAPRGQSSTRAERVALEYASQILETAARNNVPFALGHPEAPSPVHGGSSKERAQKAARRRGTASTGLAPTRVHIRVQDTCPQCAHHPVLIMDAVEAVLLCPTASCAYARPFQNLTCSALTHEDRPATTRGAATPSAELFSVMQRVSGNENKPVPVTVLKAVMAALYKAGVPPLPHTVTYDAVVDALRSCGLAKHYGQRAQIRARIMGIPAPQFSAHQKATLTALHAIEAHMQPWVDPKHKCQNMATRLVFLCQRMGWWEHMITPRMLTGPQSHIAYDAVNRVMWAALGWPFYGFAETLRNRAAAEAHQAQLERAVRAAQLGEGTDAALHGPAPGPESASRTRAAKPARGGRGGQGSGRRARARPREATPA